MVAVLFVDELELSRSITFLVIASIFLFSSVLVSSFDGCLDGGERLLERFMGTMSSRVVM